MTTFNESKLIERQKRNHQEMSGEKLADFKIKLIDQIKNGEKELTNNNIDSLYWVYILNEYKDESRTIDCLLYGTFYDRLRPLMELINDTNLESTEFYTVKVFDIRDLEIWAPYIPDESEFRYEAKFLKHKGLVYNLYIDRINTLAKEKADKALVKAIKAEKERKYEPNLLDDIKSIEYNGKTIQLVSYGRDKYSPVYRDRSLVWAIKKITCKGTKEDFIQTIKQMFDDLPEIEPGNHLENTKSEICLLMIDGYFGYREETTEMTTFCCMKCSDAKRPIGYDSD